MSEDCRTPLFTVGPAVGLLSDLDRSDSCSVCRTAVGDTHLGRVIAVATANARSGADINQGATLHHGHHAPSMRIGSRASLRAPAASSMSHVTVMWAGLASFLSAAPPKTKRTCYTPSPPRCVVCVHTSWTTTRVHTQQLQCPTVWLSLRSSLCQRAMCTSEMVATTISTRPSITSRPSQAPAARSNRLQRGNALRGASHPMQCAVGLCTQTQRRACSISTQPVTEQYCPFNLSGFESPFSLCTVQG